MFCLLNGEWIASGAQIPPPLAYPWPPPAVTKSCGDLTTLWSPAWGTHKCMSAMWKPWQWAVLRAVISNWSFRTSSGERCKNSEDRHPFPAYAVEVMQRHGWAQLPHISGQHLSQAVQDQLQRHATQTNEMGIGGQIYCLVLEKSEYNFLVFFFNQTFFFKIDEKLFLVRNLGIIA